MSSVAKLESYQQKSVADDLLIQFDSAQKQLIKSIADLARVTSSPSPVPAKFARARLSVKQAVLARSNAFNNVCEFLRTRVGADQWISIAALKAADTGLRLYSAAHLAEWTDERTEADWAGYCLASKGMRMRTGETIQRARAVLCPLLEQISKSRVNECAIRDTRIVARGLEARG
jgi:hypothetical protein